MTQEKFFVVVSVYVKGQRKTLIAKTKYTFSRRGGFYDVSRLQKYVDAIHPAFVNLPKYLLVKTRDGITKYIGHFQNFL